MKDGSNAIGKLAVEREANAGSGRPWKRLAYTLCGRGCPIESTVTGRLPCRTAEDDVTDVVSRDEAGKSRDVVYEFLADQRVVRT